MAVSSLTKLEPFRPLLTIFLSLPPLIVFSHLSEYSDYINIGYD